jgi:type IV pilus assembly protein PilB
MTTPILEIGPVEAMMDRSPIQKLIAMLLLLAIKDRGSEVRFQALKDKCRLSYVVKGVPLELVPPPAHIAPQIIRAIQAVAELDLPSFRNETRNQIQLRIGDHMLSIMVEILTNEKGQEAIIHIPDPGELSRTAQIFLNAWLERRQA